MWRTTVIAVTGSVGKTTCRELLYQILADQGSTYKTPNNENDAYGLPTVLLGLRPWHRFAVIEVAASGVGTLGPLAQMAKPDIAIITTVARTHTSEYPDIEAIAHEKAQLLRYLKPKGIAILNGDDHRVAAMATQPSQSRVEFGCEAPRAIRASQVSAKWPARLRLTVASKNGLQDVKTQLVGAHWLNAVLAAYAAAEQCGVPTADVAAAIQKVKPFRGRMQPINLPSGAVAISDQNASRDVFEAMVAVAAEADVTRKLVVLSGLNDTQLNGSKARRRYTARAVAQTFDVAVFFGESETKARNAAVAAGMAEENVHCANSIGEVDSILRDELRVGDLLFIKGRNLYHLNRLIYTQFGAIGCQKYKCSIRIDCEICKQLRPTFDLATVTAAPAV